MLRRLSAVIGKELSSAAGSPAAWVFLVIFLVLSSFCAFVAGGMFASGQADLAPFFDWMPWLFLLIVPALAMPMWSEERRLGVYELTLSFPASPGEIAFGKWIAGACLLAVALLLTASVPITALVLGEPDIGAILCGYAGALMLGCVYLAMASFCSSVSKSQTASFLLSVTVCGFFLFAGWQRVTDLLLLWLPQSAVRAISSCSFLSNYQAFQKGVADTSEIVYAVAVSGFFLCLTRYTLEYVPAASGGIFSAGAWRNPAGRRAGLRLILRTLRVLLVSLALIVLGRVWKTRIDWSSDRAYSIAPASAELAGSLEQEVLLRFYASRTSPAMQPFLRKYADRVEWLLREFAGASHGKMTLQVLDPADDSIAEESAAIDGCTPRTDDTGNAVYLGVSVSHGGRTCSVPFLSPVQETQLEFELARILRNVLLKERPVIGIMSPFPVFGNQPDLADFQQRDMETVKADPPWYVISELARDYQLVNVPMDAPEIPAEVKSLIVIHPSGITGRTLFAIDQFVLGGGRLAVFLDPRSFYAALKGHKDYAMLEKLESDLGPLPAAWGVSYDKSILAADMVSAYRRRLPDRMVTNPLVLDLQPGAISRGSELTGKLNSVSLYFSGILTPMERPGLTHEILLKTSAESQPVPVAMSDRSEQVLRGFRSSGAELALGLRISGNFRTAYPDGAPDKTVWTSAVRKESAVPGEIFLFADSDMLFNDVCIARAADVGGNQTWVRANDNVTFVQNLAERMTGMPSLSTVRSRIPMSRPLTKINEWKANAELRYRNKILAIEKEFRTSANRLVYLTRLQKSKPSREGKAEIRSITARNMAARRELKALRQSLKSDLDRIEIRIRILNLAVIPGCVALVGILVFVIRHSRMTRKDSK